MPKQNTPRKSRRQRGQSLVEFAFALPIFLLLVLGIVDFGMGLKTWISITNAARESARYGAVYCASGNGDLDGDNDMDEDDVILRAINTATGLGLEDSNVTVSDNCEGGSSTESLVVEIEYEYDLITPLAGMLSILGGGIPDSITLNTTADMRIE
jgi:Flp pilus assembly protein TadG